MSPFSPQQCSGLTGRQGQVSVLGFPGCSVAENLPAEQEISESGRSPGEGNGNHSSILAWRTHGQKSLVGYSRIRLSDGAATDCLFPDPQSLLVLSVHFCWHVWLQASALSSILSPFLLKIGNCLFSCLYVSSNPFKYLILKYINTSIAYHRSQHVPTVTSSFQFLAHYYGHLFQFHFICKFSQIFIFIISPVYTQCQF